MKLGFVWCAAVVVLLHPASIAAVHPIAASTSGTVSFEERLADPPADARILKIIHPWPDGPEAQDSLMARLQAQGFGGVVCNVSFEQYLESEAKWGAFRRAVDAAKHAGMALWLYDERGYPSGNAGGLVLREHPDWEASGLLIASLECEAGPVELVLPPGRPILVAAFPVRDGQLETKGKVDLAVHLAGGRVRWQAPAGRWHLLAFTESRLYEGTHAEGNLAEKMPYINLLRPEPTARFLELTHDRYAARLGADLGRYFMATFTDEPSLMSCFLRPMPYRPLPWAPGLPAAFRHQRGYALDSRVLPALVANAGPGTMKYRHDFWLTAGELVAENYFGQIQTWCHRHNLASGGHLLMEESLVAHVPLYGDFFRCARRLDAPSIDCLTSLPAEVPWYIARLMASAAELEDRPLVMCETSDHSQVWRPPGDQRPKRVVSEAEIRGTCNRLMVSGVNCITSYYSFSDLADEQLRRLNEWVGRCCTALRGGIQVADIAVVYPIESVWTKFTPARHWANEAPAAARIEEIYRTAADSLFAAQREFIFIDSRALVEAKVEAGVLVHGKHRWRVVVLPGTDTLPQQAWDNLRRFVARGGVVIALGALPANSDREFPSRRAQTVAKEVFGDPRNETSVLGNKAGGAGFYLPTGSEGLLGAVLREVLEPQLEIKPSGAPVRVTHRRFATRDLFFLVNDSGKGWDGEVGFTGAAHGIQWDPASGRKSQTLTDAPASVHLGPYGAALFEFAEVSPPKRRTVGARALPALEERRLPVVEPKVAAGEFVRAELVTDPRFSRAGRTVWRAKGVLTKSQTDTYLFVRLPYTPPLDLSSADCLALETWVPAGQTTPSRLLVILHEQGGGDFLATTARLLSAPGSERTFVPLARFQLAGWSKDADGELDLKRVDEVRVGWGGYYGAEGETVEFGLGLPSAGSMKPSPDRTAQGGAGARPAQP